MQEANINFKGVSLTPYSDISPDGQLSACIGLESYGGSLRPSVLSGTKYTLPDDGNNYRLVHIHTTSAYSHFILAAGDSVYWADVTEGTLTVSPVGTFTGFSSANSVGNTLVILTSGGLHYSLWKEGSYEYIGQQPPEIGISFGLYISTYERSSDSGSVSFEPELAYTSDYPTRQILIADKNNQRENLTDIVWQAVNKVIEACSENSHFCMPFFVRAAYRRFDGSYAMLTAPVLMIPDSVGPKALFSFEKKEAYKLTGKVYARAWGCTLAASLSSTFAAELDSWKDILSSIDIFVSPQVMRADNSEKVSVLYGQMENELTWHEPPGSYSIGSARRAGSYFKRHDFDWELSSTDMKYFKLPMKEEDAFLQNLNGSLQFYKVCSISVLQVASISSKGFFSVLKNSVDLSNLVQQEALDDSSDYQSHDTLVSLRSHVYNQRLHLFDVERILFGGYSPENAWSYTDDGTSGQVTVSVYVAAEDGTTRVVSVTSPEVSLSQLGRFLYYPNINAGRMVITGSGFQYDIPLQPHPLLNGAYYLFMDTHPSQVSVSVPDVSNAPIAKTNMIYTSEVGNPFYFPLEGIYTVGSGKIYGISSVATALSQGQFGQFPLMIFCSDGNYAMSVNDEGRYSAIYPVQRDVCVNPEGIVQTDSEVLFVSSRGVMVTSGAAANSISSDLDGVPESLPPEFESWSYPYGSPSDFFRSCRIAYDYASRRILFFLEGNQYAYIYSLNDGTWSTALFGHIKSVLNYYPYSYIQLGNGDVVRLDDVYDFSHSNSQIQGLLYTRPVKFSTYQLKRLHQISVQGVFSKAQELFVYASNDGRSWHLLGSTKSLRKGSMRGRPFKYYRFGVITSLAPNEHITSIKVEFDVLPQLKLR